MATSPEPCKHKRELRDQAVAEHGADSPEAIAAQAEYDACMGSQSGGHGGSGDPPG